MLDLFIASDLARRREARRYETPRRPARPEPPSEPARGSKETRSPALRRALFRSLRAG